METGRSPRAPRPPPAPQEPPAPAPVDPPLSVHSCRCALLDRDPGRRCDPWPPETKAEAKGPRRVWKDGTFPPWLPLPVATRRSPSRKLRRAPAIAPVDESNKHEAAVPSLQAPLPCGQQHHQRPSQNHKGLDKWQRQPLFAWAASSRRGRAARRSTCTNTLHC